MDIGIIEGFYGKPWTWEEREETTAVLAAAGYRFYLYAPKADLYLRRHWQEDHPDRLAEPIGRFAARCRELGVRFGIGLSPYEIYLGFDDKARAALERKLDFFRQVGVQDLAILFDDMRGDVPSLAELQVEVVDFVAERTSADRLLVCPSYYSDDPVLDRVFGSRPPSYLRKLGELLDPSIEIFWTGEEVCSREISAAHLDRVADRLGRKPFLWDNYPVNDGPRMSQFLHLRGFTGRRGMELVGHAAAHAVNPALQPTLTRIAALTLVDVYEQGDDYQYGEATTRAALQVLGPELGRMVRDDLLTLQDIGLDRLGEKEAILRERYGAVDHPGAREIIEWLDGVYAITEETVHTQ